MLPLERPATAAIAMVLGITGHTAGWPIARGGAQNITRALASYFHSLGGEIVSGVRVDSIDTLPSARAILCDVTPRQLLQIAGHRLPHSYRRRLQRYRYGVGAYKVDWAWQNLFPGPPMRVLVPALFTWVVRWKRFALPNKRRGKISRDPAVCVTDTAELYSIRPVRPKGGILPGRTVTCRTDHLRSMVDQIEAQVERFAPGFRARIMARERTVTP